MNLWIRSQNREQLSKPNKLYVKILNEERYEILSGEGFYVLGTYKTKERALEVLDEIQNILKPNIEYIPIVEEDVKPEYKYKHYKTVGYEVHGCKIEQFDTYVYEMPKE